MLQLNCDNHFSYPILTGVSYILILFHVPSFTVSFKLSTDHLSSNFYGAREFFFLLKIKTIVQAYVEIWNVPVELSFEL